MSCKDELAAREEPVEAEELAHRHGVGVVRDRVADALAAGAVMLPDPDPAAVRGVVEAVRVQHALDLGQPHGARILRRHLVARGLDHQAELVLRLRIDVVMQREPGEERVPRANEP